ncbi:MAG: ABC transporter ATP-binding protein [Geminicoccaceae bacterium]|nr:MAG: ABC transporter ATP-binding protein [Geminicoccaceae bacterium]
MSAPALALEGVRRSFVQAGARIDVLQGIDLTVARGELVALVGVSGAGKSTLLHIAGLLERPDAGEVRILGEPTSNRRDAARTRLRRETIGFVYQFHHLLPEFGALENVVLPLRLAGVGQAEARARAGELLGGFGLEERLGHRPAQLSGGEQQRVAMARALANRPALVLADEPTGNLDEVTAATVFDTFRQALAEANAGALVATHDRRLAAKLDRCFELRQGRLHDLALGSAA